MMKKLLIVTPSLTRSGLPITLQHFVLGSQEHVKCAFLLISSQENDLEFMKTLGGSCDFFNVRLPNPNSRKFRFLPHFFSFLIKRKVRSAILSFHPDAVLAPEIAIAGAVLAEAKRSGVSSLFCQAHSIWRKGSKKNPIYACWQRNNKKLVNFYATKRTAVSLEAGKALFDKPFEVIPPGADFFQAKVTNPHDRILRMGQIGVFSSLKNQLFSLNLCLSLRSKGLPFELDLLGSPLEKAYYKRILNFISKQGMADYVHIYPGDFDRQLFFDRIDVLLFPSTSEGFGMVLVEAQSAKLPCLVSDSVPRTTNCGLCNYLPLENPDSWVSWLGGESKQKKLALNESRLNEFSYTHYCDKLFAFFEL